MPSRRRRFVATLIGAAFAVSIAAPALAADPPKRAECSAPGADRAAQAHDPAHGHRGRRRQGRRGPAGRPGTPAGGRPPVRGIVRRRRRQGRDRREGAVQEGARAAGQGHCRRQGVRPLHAGPGPHRPGHQRRDAPRRREGARQARGQPVGRLDQAGHRLPDVPAARPSRTWAAPPSRPPGTTARASASPSSTAASTTPTSPSAAPGTLAAYEAAYGTSPTDPRNTTKDGLFPTARVVGGYDFVGEAWVGGATTPPLAPDPDPIDYDGPRHARRRHHRRRQGHGPGCLPVRREGLRLPVDGLQRRRPHPGHGLRRRPQRRRLHP